MSKKLIQSKIKPIEIIKKYYEPDSLAFYLVVEHGKVVGEKALRIAQNVMYLKPNLSFIEEASMLHDIGIKNIYAPQLGCFGDEPDICHGFRGREILEKEGLHKHALVCERHTGMGLTLEDIRVQNLPIPKRSMMPITIEEQIICLADKFFTKNKNKIHVEKNLEEIKNDLSKFGDDKVARFNNFLKKFNYLDE